MRRRSSWAVLGTSGVLAVIVGTMMMNDDDETEKVAGPQIIVPLAEDAVVDLPTTTATRPSTVFIDVPPVAVTSETTVPTPSQEPEPVAPPPKKAATPPPPSSKPVLPVPPVEVPPVMPKPGAPQSFWKLYPGYMNYYGPGGGYYGGYGYGYGYGGPGPYGGYPQGPYGYPQGGYWGR